MPVYSKVQLNCRALLTSAVMLDQFAEHQNVALLFVALGVLSCAKFALKATGVLLQTFVLPGTGVSRAIHNPVLTIIDCDAILS